MWNPRNKGSSGCKRLAMLWIYLCKSGNHILCKVTRDVIIPLEVFVNVVSLSLQLHRAFSSLTHDTISLFSIFLSQCDFSSNCASHNIYSSNPLTKNWIFLHTLNFGGFLSSNQLRTYVLSLSFSPMLHSFLSGAPVLLLTGVEKKSCFSVK